MLFFQIGKNSKSYIFFNLIFQQVLESGSFDVGGKASNGGLPPLYQGINLLHHELSRGRIRILVGKTW